jgi:hypothetical protein
VRNRRVIELEIPIATGVLQLLDKVVCLVVVIRINRLGDPPQHHRGAKVIRTFRSGFEGYAVQ